MSGAGEATDARRAAHREASTSGQGPSSNGDTPAQTSQWQAVNKAEHMTEEVRRRHLSRQMFSFEVQNKALNSQKCWHDRIRLTYVSLLFDMLVSWNTGLGASGGAGQGTLASAEGARGRQIRGVPLPLHLPSVSLGFECPCSKRSVFTACGAFAACCTMMMGLS